MVIVQRIRPALDLSGGQPLWVPCGFGLYFPARLKGLAELVSKLDGGTLEVELEFATYENVGVVEQKDISVTSLSLRIGQVVPGAEITSELLRKVPIGRIANDVLRVSLAIETGDNRFGPASLFEVPHRVRAKWPASVDEEFYHYLGTAYHLAEFCGMGPTAEIAKKFGVSRATAGRMVDAARQASWIDITSAPESPVADDQWFQQHLRWLERAVDLQAPPESLPADAPDFGDLIVLKKVFEGAN